MASGAHRSGDTQRMGGSAGQPLAEGQGSCDTHPTTALGNTFPGQRSDDAHLSGAGEPPAERQLTRDDQGAGALGSTLPEGQASFDTQTENALGEPSTNGAGGGGHGHLCGDARKPAAMPPSSGLLLIYADLLDDLESTRIATENRVRALSQVQHREGSPEQEQLDGLVKALKVLEHDAELALGRAIRAHPLGPWVKRTLGVGPKQGPRLIAAIGDPAWNHKDNRPRRGPAELWAYCGYAPGQRRRKGERSNWNATAKMRANRVAEKCMTEMRSPFRPVYDKARANWADRDTTNLHKHNHALRCVAKAVLADLWREAQALNPAPANDPATPIPAAPGQTLPPVESGAAA